MASRCIQGPFAWIATVLLLDLVGQQPIDLSSEETVGDNYAYLRKHKKTGNFVIELRGKSYSRIVKGDRSQKLTKMAVCNINSRRIGGVVGPAPPVPANEMP